MFTGLGLISPFLIDDLPKIVQIIPYIFCIVAREYNSIMGGIIWLFPSKEVDNHFYIGLTVIPSDC